MSAKFLDNLYL